MRLLLNNKSPGRRYVEDIIKFKKDQSYGPWSMDRSCDGEYVI